jgi:hypothetical protein
MTRIGTLLALCVAFLIAACGPKVVGSYKGSVEGMDKDNPMSGMAEAMAGSMTLDIRQDNTFTATIMFTLEGKWSISGNTLTLQPEKVVGMAGAEANKPMEFTIENGGKRLVAKDSQQEKLVFIKE